ncbi:MAG TPA: hypothetical protein VE130_15150 [Nitrososphaeraceae archaeon]|nr:hypothetical protein [Nitrososphaeraceae archaeon]
MLALVLSFSVGMAILLIAWEDEIIQQRHVLLGQLRNDSSSLRDITKTFNARGTINSIVTDTLVGSNSMGIHSGDLWILGGNWSLSVVNGNLSNFNTDILMTKYDGTGRYTHFIGMLTNATGVFKGAAPPASIESIGLTNENNFFHGKYQYYNRW